MARSIFSTLIAALLLYVSALPARALEMPSSGAEVFRYRNRDWVNYRLLLDKAGPSSLPLIKLGDLLLLPNTSPDLVLHGELLETLYRENRRNVFFIVEVPPYYPENRHRHIPWLGTANHYFFGNCFWTSDAQIRSVYRRVYGDSRTDFNSTMRRVRIYNSSGVKPRAVVFATLSRTGANTMWRNAWGWEHYYYFTGVHAYAPRD